LAAACLFVLAGGLLLWLEWRWALLGCVLALCLLGARASGQRKAGQRSSSRGAAAYARRYQRGMALQEQGRLEEAFGLFRHLPTSPELLQSLCMLAGGFERQRDLGKARKVFKHVLQRDANHEAARTGYQRVKDIQHALRALQAPAVQALPSSGSALLPRLGPYQPECILGRGAMGAVYLARDPATGQELALKTLSLGQEFEGAALDEARQRFFREAAAAGRLQHPCIVRIHDSGDAQGVTYIAMERLQGQDLSAACAPGRLLPVRQVLGIADRIAQALHYAHANQVIHRDIKPANIMFDAATDTVKVMDFGIARITDGHKTRTGLVLGTPSFMPPEQLMGQAVDGRSDLYALGATLFQLLTGTLPLRGRTMAELMQRIVHEPAPNLRDVRPELPPALAAVVARLLAKAREDRYATGAELAQDLRACETYLPEQITRGAAESLVYDANSDAPGDAMADFQQTIMDPSSPPGPSSRGRFSDVL